MSTIAGPEAAALTVPQIDKRLAMYARRLAGAGDSSQTVEGATLAEIRLTRQQALENVDMLLDLRLELTGASA